MSPRVLNGTKQHLRRSSSCSPRKSRRDIVCFFVRTVHDMQRLIVSEVEQIRTTTDNMLLTRAEQGALTALIINTTVCMPTAVIITTAHAAFARTLYCDNTDNISKQREIYGIIYPVLLMHVALKRSACANLTFETFKQVQIYYQRKHDFLASLLNVLSDPRDQLFICYSASAIRLLVHFSDSAPHWRIGAHLAMCTAKHLCDRPCTAISGYYNSAPAPVWDIIKTMCYCESRACLNDLHVANILLNLSRADHNA